MRGLICKFDDNKNSAWIKVKESLGDKENNIIPFELLKKEAKTEYHLRLKEKKMSNNNPKRRGIYVAHRLVQDKFEMDHLDIFILGASNYKYNTMSYHANTAITVASQLCPRALMSVKHFYAEKDLLDKMVTAFNIVPDGESFMSVRFPNILFNFNDSESKVDKFLTAIGVDSSDLKEHLLSQLDKIKDLIDNKGAIQPLPDDHQFFNANDVISLPIYKYIQSQFEELYNNERQYRGVNIFCGIHPALESELVINEGRNTLIILDTTHNTDFYDENIGWQCIDDFLDYGFEVVGRAKDTPRDEPSKQNFVDIKNFIGYQVSFLANNALLGIIRENDPEMAEEVLAKWEDRESAKLGSSNNQVPEVKDIPKVNGSKLKEVSFTIRKSNKNK